MGGLSEENARHILNAILVVAALIATLTFQAGLNPPGGFWQDWPNNPAHHDHNRPGSTINEDMARSLYYKFLTTTTFAFTNSMGAVVMIIVLGLWTNKQLQRVFLRLVSILVFAASISVFVAYDYGLRISNEKKLLDQDSPWETRIYASFVALFVVLSAGFVVMEIYDNRKERKMQEAQPG